ncbi:MAG: hypothetical protein HN919_18690 [Verrucomicrobia bacterium]|jgi:hypothetical protein|nr:hypothetical protein [Verrucomicrobiota bacterium]MBT7068332.1 hypothetical protein [Verrucomicrobiota bacterium]MBT7700257.1 hypothetical protein [Verrucomicrobiota bacterium]
MMKKTNTNHRTIGWATTAMAAAAASTANADFVQINLTGNQVTAGGGVGGLYADLDGDLTDDVTFTDSVAWSNTVSGSYLMNRGAVRIDGNALLFIGGSWGYTSSGFSSTTQQGPGNVPKAFFPISLTGKPGKDAWLEVDARANGWGADEFTGDPNAGVYLTRVVYDHDGSETGSPDTGTTYPTTEPPPPPAAPTVDGEDIANIVTHTGQEKFWSDANGNIGQSFTTGANGGALRAVSMPSNDPGTPTQARVYSVRVVQIDGSGNTTTVAKEDGHEITAAYVAGEWLTWTLNTPVSLSPNTLYGIDLEHTGGGDYNNGIPYPRYSGNEYAGGSFYQRADGDPSTVSYNTGRDYIFHLDIDGGGTSATPGTLIYGK